MGCWIPFWVHYICLPPPCPLFKVMFMKQHFCVLFHVLGTYWLRSTVMSSISMIGSSLLKQLLCALLLKGNASWSNPHNQRGKRKQMNLKTRVMLQFSILIFFLRCFLYLHFEWVDLSQLIYRARDVNIFVPYQLSYTDTIFPTEWVRSLNVLDIVLFRARFCSAVTELQITGLIRMPSKRRPDYVQRVAFGL